MTRDQQQSLAKELATSFVEEFLLAAEQAPPEWSGVELRLLLRDVTSERFVMSTTRQRKAAYLNDRMGISI